MWARISRFRLPKERIDKDVRQAKEVISESVVTIPGSRGAYYLVDRDRGETLAITLWDDEQALRASEERAARIREEAGAESGSEVVSVDRYEVALQPADFPVAKAA